MSAFYMWQCPEKGKSIHGRIPGGLFISSNLACVASVSFLQKGSVTLPAPYRAPIRHVVRQSLSNCTVKSARRISIDTAGKENVNHKDLLFTEPRKAKSVLCHSPCAWSHGMTLNERSPMTACMGGITLSLRALLQTTTKQFYRLNTGVCNCTLRGHQSRKSRAST